MVEEPWAVLAADAVCLWDFVPRLPFAVDVLFGVWVEPDAGVAVEAALELAVGVVVAAGVDASCGDGIDEHGVRHVDVFYVGDIPFLFVGQPFDIVDGDGDALRRYVYVLGYGVGRVAPDDGLIDWPIAEPAPDGEMHRVPFCPLHCFKILLSRRHP